VARAVPAVFENKSESVAKSALLQITHRSGRFDGGSVELSPVFEKRHTPRETPANSEHVEDRQRVPNDINKQEEATSGSTELLMKSLLVVFERAGTRGLTAREAVAKLVEYDLPGLQSGERSSVQVSKVLRTRDFVHLEDGKYFIYPSTPHAVVAESSTQSEPSQDQGTFQARQDISGNSVPYLHVSRRKPKKASVSDGSKENTTSDVSEKNASQLEEKIELKKRRRRPPSSQHELAIGPRQCKRYDGRGWQCTRETEEGLSFCEHHQALMNKRTLRLNLAKKKRKGAGSGTDIDMDVEPQPSKASVGSVLDEGSSKSSKDQQLVVVSGHGIDDLIHNQRRRLVKARSLKSIK
jgi:hypothetical protein